mmetsp:Transcript_9536/g.26357  ORF Transcript_9536/g.26357 Transcript_9536/m.26357 type:complete len:258 (-) Transcript_9536:760-1533(-)
MSGVFQHGIRGISQQTRLIGVPLVLLLLLLLLILRLGTQNALRAMQHNGTILRQFFTLYPTSGAPSFPDIVVIVVVRKGCENLGKVAGSHSLRRCCSRVISSLTGICTSSNHHGLLLLLLLTFHRFGCRTTSRRHHASVDFLFMQLLTEQLSLSFCFLGTQLSTRQDNRPMIHVGTQDEQDKKGVKAQKERHSVRPHDAFARSTSQLIPNDNDGDTQGGNVPHEGPTTWHSTRHQHNQCRNNRGNDHGGTSESPQTE